MLRFLSLALASFFSAPAAVAQVRFVEQGAARGILAHHPEPGMGSGVSAADYDGDGFVDLYVPTGAGFPDQVYHNRGDGSFEEVAASLGLDSLDAHRVGVWFDAEGDGDLDLLVSGGDCYQSCDGRTPPLHYYRQEADGRFRELTEAAGFALPPHYDEFQHAAGISAGDLDQDGDLDLIVIVWRDQSYFFVNQGNGTFRDRAAGSGIFLEPDAHYPFPWQSVLHDFDRDGWLDIYLAVDYSPNRLLLNRHDGTFVEVAERTHSNNAMNDMGLALGDYDNDSDFDLYVSNIEALQGGDGFRNVLLRNQSERGSLDFEEVGREAGVESGGWGWGTTFLDVDNDGDLDLAETNGYGTVYYQSDRSRLFLSSGGADPVFLDVSQASGFDDDFVASGLVSLDLENDGDLDLVQVVMPTFSTPGRLRLLVNKPGEEALGNHWLGIRPRMHGSNSHAIGAIVRLRVGTEVQSRAILVGQSYLGQEPAEARFGLGAARQADELVIEWPDGSTTRWTGVRADAIRTLWPDGRPGDLDQDADVDATDLALLLGSYGRCTGCAADLNDDGRVDRFDAKLLIDAMDD